MTSAELMENYQDKLKNVEFFDLSTAAGFNRVFADSMAFEKSKC